MVHHIQVHAAGTTPLQALSSLIHHGEKRIALYGSPLYPCQRINGLWLAAFNTSVISRATAAPTCLDLNVSGDHL